MHRLGLAVLVAFLATADLIGAIPSEPRWRRPVALALSADQQRLFIANQSSGSISVIDTATNSVLTEIDVGGRLSDIAIWNEKYLLTVAEDQHELVLLFAGEEGWQVAQRWDVAPYPVQLVIDDAGQRCFVSSLWSRLITVVNLASISLADQQHGPSIQQLPLPFEPRLMCLSPDARRLIVASSFGGDIGVVDTTRFMLTAVKRMRGHNIRGMVIGHEGRRLFVSQQELNPLGHSTRDDVHWGNMLSNQLVSWSLDKLCDPALQDTGDRQVYRIGKPGNGSGDPGPVAIGAHGKLYVALSGVNELALSDPPYTQARHRIAVDRRPVAIALAKSGVCYIANQFSDSVSVIAGPHQTEAESISLGQAGELDSVARGEMAFFDSRLSHDGWMSCHSCHTDGHSSGQLNDNQSDGAFESPKRVLSLLGVRDTGPWAWNGQAVRLEAQVRSSLMTTMQGADPSEETVSSIAAYLKSLPPPPAKQPGDAAPIVERGRQVFESLKCDRCHRPPTYSTAGVFDVGLTDHSGNDRFNPPSLRGVGRRNVLFHDGRAHSLGEVFVDYEHQLATPLSGDDLANLIEFLQSL